MWTLPHAFFLGCKKNIISQTYENNGLLNYLLKRNTIIDSMTIGELSDFSINGLYHPTKQG